MFRHLHCFTVAELERPFGYSMVLGLASFRHKKLKTLSEDARAGVSFCGWLRRHYKTLEIKKYYCNNNEIVQGSKGLAWFDLYYLDRECNPKGSGSE